MALHQPGSSICSNSELVLSLVVVLFVDSAIFCLHNYATGQFDLKSKICNLGWDKRNWNQLEYVNKFWSEIKLIDL